MRTLIGGACTVAIGLLSTSMWTSTPAQAQSCDRGEVESTIPRLYDDDGDLEVLAQMPTNAMLFARYSANAAYDDEDVLFGIRDDIDPLTMLPRLAAIPATFET